MTERPILFKAEMIRAILDGRKTQTRRVVTWNNSCVDTPRNFHCDLDRAWVDNSCGLSYLHVPFAHPDDGLQGDDDACGRWTSRIEKGDTLWCRETHSFSSEAHPLNGNVHPFEDGLDIKCWYKANNDRPTWAECNWRPSIFMPRWASRLQLDVEEVRVQRVQDISEEDAIAEGIGEFQIGLPRRELELGNAVQASALALGLATSANKVSRRAFLKGGSAAFAGIAGWLSGNGKWPDPEEMNYRHTFALLWDHINAKRGFSWDSNPFVWAVSFRRIER